MKKSRYVYAVKLILIFCFIIMAGCAGKSKKVTLFRHSGGELVYPAPPDVARIKFLYSIQEDRKQNTQATAARAEFDQRFFLRPYSLYLDTAEHLYVVDQGLQNVVIVNLKENSIELLDRNEDIFLNPISVTIDNVHRIYVTDAGGWIAIFNAAGKFEKMFEPSEKISRPAGIAFNKINQLLYIIDVAEHKVKIFDVNGKLVKAIGAQGGKEGEFNYPTHIALDADGNFYVTDTLNFRIQKFSPGGEFMKLFGSLGDSVGHFSKPKGIAIDTEGNIYIVDSYFDNIQLFNNEGRILMAFGNSGTKMGEFWLPAGIYISDDNRIFIADTYNSRVQVFQLIQAGSTGN
ncbi:MAG: hypothetical protein A2Y62_18325 [Candidatus Fischerbacteria bacterium RBG_13_37_8]|uniref:6-bladed beta-propeller n=1 Tax=Candidatus Fischerbacteria bacterium RBG_13_37_8 TaxID=1817863 RepID=A0A1F5VP44_9BACT|nr:MAG: hypothetical protein A2Y62_18325 [Candidatus Fischerbacteria bacterium RBG_13_37_8]